MLFLDKYESLGVLGRGSMGQVHAARPMDDPATTVVVKVMRPDLTETPRAREFFAREIKYTARLRHPYIVRVLDAGIDLDAGPCIVMEFVPGTTLEQLLKAEQRLLVHRTAWLAGCLCHALQAAHTAAVIHRDLKPANLMVVSSGTPQEHLKVMDFGLSHLASKPYLSRERLSGIAVIEAHGTPAYISPEQLRGDDVDGRTDIYGAGIVLFEALAGRQPFSDATIEGLIEAHLRRPPPTFAELQVKDVPAAVETVIRKCLAKFPRERPASARALANELGTALGIDLWAETTPVTEVRTADLIPIAEDVPSEPAGDSNALIRKVEAWMPDRIAVIKLGGFLQDAGAEIVSTQPGILKAKFRPHSNPGGMLARLFAKNNADGIALDLMLDRPNAAESRLVVTAVFRIPGGGTPRNKPAWASRCLGIFEEMRRYLMAAR
jgi:eukaryotic-like serine/threonine-protein kinase